MTEIPEPDYDDDDDAEVDHVSTAADPEVSDTFCDNDKTAADDELRENGDRAAADAAGQLRDDDDVDTDHDLDEEDDADDGLDFDGVRAKLEAFSVSQQLRGSVSTTDQGCPSVRLDRARTGCVRRATWLGLRVSFRLLPPPLNLIRHAWDAPPVSYTHLTLPTILRV